MRSEIHAMPPLKYVLPLIGSAALSGVLLLGSPVLALLNAAEKNKSPEMLTAQFVQACSYDAAIFSQGGPVNAERLRECMDRAARAHKQKIKSIPSAPAVIGAGATLSIPFGVAAWIVVRRIEKWDDEGRAALKARGEAMPPPHA